MSRSVVPDLCLSAVAATAASAALYLAWKSFRVKASSEADSLELIPVAPEFHKTNYLMLYALVSKESRKFTAEEVAVTLPRTHPREVPQLPGKPTFLIPVRKLWDDIRILCELSPAKAPTADHRPSRRFTRKSLADPCAKAAWFYSTGSITHELNEAIQNDDRKALQPYMRLVRNLQSYILSHRSPQALTVYRTTTMPSERLTSLHRGVVYRLSQFVTATSTPRSPSPGYPNQQACVLEFQIPKGCLNAAVISEFSETCGEIEVQVVIPPYTTVRCTGVRRGLCCGGRSGVVVQLAVMQDCQDWEMRHEELGGAVFVSATAGAGSNGKAAGEDEPYRWRVTDEDVEKCFTEATCLSPADREKWLSLWNSRTAPKGRPPERCMWMYTVEMERGVISPRQLIDTALREADEPALEELSPWLEGIREYFLEHPLSTTFGTVVYRSVNFKTSAVCFAGHTISWKGFTSVTSDVNVLRENLSIPAGPCTVYLIQVPPRCHSITDCAAVCTSEPHERNELTIFSGAELLVLENTPEPPFPLSEMRWAFPVGTRFVMLELTNSVARAATAAA